MTNWILSVILALTLEMLATRVHGFGPKLLYSLNFDRDIAAIKIINRQLFIMAPYQISVVDNIQWKFRQRKRMLSRVINKEIADPRMIGRIPAGTFRGDKTATYWVSSRGTNDTNGAIYVLKQTSTYSLIQDITVDSGWSYEKAQWVDMNMDGRRDCLTARYRGGVGQMLWFEQPSGQSIWGQRIIHEGLADGNFVGFVYDKKTYIAVASSQFNTLGLYWTMHPRNNWVFSRQVRHRVLDNYGRYFDVQYVDLNRDGRPDVLTTTVQIANSRGQVLGYEIPYDIQNADWNRHVLAGGFVGDYSPGKATAFWPNKWKKKSDRPTIFLTGGSEGMLYLLTPTPKNKGWGYYRSELAAGVGTPGIPFIIDLNGDSFPEIFVPQGSQMHVFSYDYSSSAANAPKKASSNAGKVTITKPTVVFRNPFFRPTPSRPPPAIPAGATPVGGSIGRGPIGGVPIDDTAGNLPSGTGGNSGRFSPARPASGNNAVNRQPPSGNPTPFLPPATVSPVVVVGPNGLLYTRLGPNYVPLPFGSPLQPASVATGNDTIIPMPSDVTTPVIPPFFVESAQPELPYQQPAPPNLILWVTPDTYAFHSEARDICEVNRHTLCSIQQLQEAAINGGVIPDFEWGWYDQDKRAASLEKCTPGEVKWEGFECYNGDVQHTPVYSDANLPALCCTIVAGANVTYEKFVRKNDAARQCAKSKQHLCSLDEMLDVWDQSTYKDMMLGWFDMDGHLVKMTHGCDVNAIPWPGYMCVQGKLEVTQIQTIVQQHAFCCGSRAVRTALSFSVLIASLCFAFWFR